VPPYLFNLRHPLPQSARWSANEIRERIPGESGKEKERRPVADLTKGTDRRFLFADQRADWGRGCRRLKRYGGTV